MNEQTYKIGSEIIMTTTDEVMSTLFSAIKKMEKAGVPAGMCFELYRYAGFAATGACLSCIQTEEGQKKAVDELVERFREYLNKAIELNKGVSGSPQSSIILQ